MKWRKLIHHVAKKVFLENKQQKKNSMLFFIYLLWKKYVMSEFSSVSFMETKCFHRSRRFKKIGEQIDILSIYATH